MRAAHISKNSIVRWPPAEESWDCDTSGSVEINQILGATLKKTKSKGQRTGAESVGFVFLRTEALEIQQVGLVVHLIELQWHFGVLFVDGILPANPDMEGIDRLPFLYQRKFNRRGSRSFQLRVAYEFQRFHGSVHLVHDVMRLALRPDSQVPFGSLHRSLVTRRSFTSTSCPLPESRCVPNYNLSR